MKDSTIHISLKSILLTLLTLVCVYVLYQIRDIAMSFFLALIIMSALNPGVTWLEKRKVPRGLGIVVLYLTVFGALSLLFTIVVPPLGEEINRMVHKLQVPSLPPAITQFEWTVQDIGSLVSQFGQSVNSLVGLISSTVSGIFFFFTLLVMSFYLLMDRKNLAHKTLWIKHTDRHEKLLSEFIDDIEQRLGGWVRGQIILMFSIGIITYVILYLLGIPYALPLAVLAGFLEILPNIGPMVAAVPAVIIAYLLLSPTMAIIVAILYLLVQQLENNLFVPKIMKAAVNVEPLTSILAILIGVRLGGVGGALLAIPVYIVFRSALQTYLREIHKA
jgi:predicted PurR-regulated permease PerM